MIRLPLSLLAALLALLAVPAYAQDTRWEGEVAAFEASDAKAMPAPGGVLFLGSSSIRLWPALARDFAGQRVIQRGFGGTQIIDSVQYAERIVLPYKPKTIVFYAGDNDLGAGKPPEQVLADFKALVTKVHARLPRTRILFISIKPSIKRWAMVDKIRAANRLVRAYTATDKRLGFIDIFPAMLGADGLPRPELLGRDGLHMTAAGYAVWREKVAAALSD